MTRIEALKELLAKVEAGDLDYPYCIVQHVHGVEMNESMWFAYNGSLDAAKALHEAVLPGWLYSIENEATCVFTDDILNAELGRCDDNPARAWLIAILKALIAQEEAA